MYNLENKVAFVTGGGQGIGRGIALELAKAGAAVVVTQRKIDGAKAVAAEIEALGGHAIALSMDVSQAASIQEGVEEALKTFPHIDILVNNAGVAQQQFALDTTLGTFDQCYEVNLRGAWAVANALIPQFTSRKAGKIINIASIEGRKGTFHQPAYAASKAALISLTQSLASLLGPDNINVNAVCPGPVWTPQQENYQRLASQRGEIAADKVTEDSFFDHLIDYIPLRRAASCEDIGHVVVFLASEKAKNITGQALNVDAGLCMN